MRQLPQNVYSAANVREMDRLAIEDHGVPGYTLMCRAGDAAWRLLRARWPAARHVLVLCGAGNNAGDGYVIARLALADGYRATTVPLLDPSTLKGDARKAWQDFTDAGGRLTEWQSPLCDDADVIVDAVLGTGLDRALAGPLLAAVTAVNAASTPVLAMDIPTGLHADTGMALGEAVRADATITFVGLKAGLFSGEAWNHVGSLFCDDLGVSELVGDSLPPVFRRIDTSLVRSLLPPRSRTLHKGRAGHVLVVGGGVGMPGAVRLAAEACLRSGAGLVTVATSPESLALALSGRPEVMGIAVRSGEDLAPLIARADVIAIGPGLGQSAWARELLDTVLAAGLPVVADADALNLLAGSGVKRDDWALTPHPGEAGRLLGTDTGTVQGNRLAALDELVARYGGTVVLKGAGTLVGNDGDVPYLCDRGNPGMAAPGMGDLLTGVIAGIAAQTLNGSGDLAAACRAGVLVHAAAGDSAAARGERGLIATDLLPFILNQVNP
ncbi:MAG: NAD(P)H-hydrate dehydratase [Pseudomonadota bacterium]